MKTPHEYAHELVKRMNNPSPRTWEASEKVIADAIAAAKAEEREACAKVVDELRTQHAAAEQRITALESANTLGRG